MAKAQVKENTEDKDSFVDELKPGTKLMHGQYTIDSFLNAGGFGITYLARDSLDRKIVIKECFPGAFCRRSRYVVQARSRAHQNELKSIVRLFVQEARSLAKLDHPNIVGVHQVFEDNDTAYMALDFVEGRDLLDTIEDPNHGLTPTQIKSILKEVLGAVGFIHDQGILHRDISPDNILINKEFHPVLIDFGAAREEATKQSRVLSALRVVKDGYSPQEFYIAGSDQSPSSDLYALAASFHHLIAGDVPPNSQARLAAIASGEDDPYQPISGRFPEYDENFLAALDKALAVLPKDRVQSAKDWLSMMEGAYGNVTPLNVGKTTTAEKAAPAGAQKSKMPLLLGSAAAVALLVGVGVFTMSGSSDAPVAEAPVAQTPVAEAPAATAAEAVAEAPVAVVAEPEPVVETPLFQAPTIEVTEAPAAPELVEETIATVAPEVIDTPTVTEEPVVEEPTVNAAVEDALGEAPAPTMTEELSVPEAAPQPVIIAEPTPPAVAETTDPEIVVAGPEIIDVPTPVVRPSTRPASVELAAIPTPEPLPEPVATPVPATDATVETVTLPELAANAPIAESQTPAITLPGTPDLVAAIGDGPSVEIVAVTPGNEVAPDDVVANWSVQLPFSAVGADSNVIAATGPVAPVWVKAGLEITSVNGSAVDAINDISAVLRELNGSETSSPTITATFGTLDPATGEAADHQWILPVVQETMLLDGTRFETVFAGSGWRTIVASLPNPEAGGLLQGDVISTFIPTAETVDGPDTLMSIFERELEKGTDQFMFAVQRNGSLWVASHTYTGVSE